MPNGSTQQATKASDRKYRITATRNGPDDYSFGLTDINGGPANLVFNKSTDNMRKRDYYLLEFHLHNASGCDLEFIDDRAKVLSACRAEDAIDGCAPEGSQLPSVFYVHPTNSLGKKLVYVINTDPDWEDFYFGFSFVSKDGAETAYYDPGGNNQNAGNPFISKALVAGAVTGALAALGTAALVSNSFVPSTELIYGLGGAVLGLIVGYLLDRT